MKRFVMILNYSNFEKTPTNVVVVDTEKGTATDYVRVATLDAHRYVCLPFSISCLMEELLLPWDDTLVLKANDGVLFECEHKTTPFTSTIQK